MARGCGCRGRAWTVGRRARGAHPSWARRFLILPPDPFPWKNYIVWQRVVGLMADTERVAWLQRVSGTAYRLTEGNVRGLASVVENVAAEIRPGDRRNEDYMRAIVLALGVYGCRRLAALYGARGTSPALVVSSLSPEEVVATRRARGMAATDACEPSESRVEKQLARGPPELRPPEPEEWATTLLAGIGREG